MKHHISEVYDLPTPLPFLNVRVDTDNRLVLDPSAIRNSCLPVALRAQARLHSFFSELLRCRDSASPRDQAKGRAMLQELREPNETRLGLSRAGSKGHAFGPDLGQMLWEELKVPVCRSAALERIEDLAIFVDNVGKDLVSDMTTRVIFGVLAEFTSEMMALYPSLAKGATTEENKVWNMETKMWEAKTLYLPHSHGKQLLLVPVEWARANLLMASSRFYNHKATGTLQDEQTIYVDGKKLAPTKKLLKKQHSYVKGLNGDQAIKYLPHRNLVAELRVTLDEEFLPITAEEAQRRIDESYSRAG